MLQSGNIRSYRRQRQPDGFSSQRANLFSPETERSQRDVIFISLIRYRDFTQTSFPHLNLASIGKIISRKEAKQTAYALFTIFFFSAIGFPFCASQIKPPFHPIPSSLAASTLSSCLQVQQTKHTL